MTRARRLLAAGLCLVAAPAAAQAPPEVAPSGGAWGPPGVAPATEPVPVPTALPVMPIPSPTGPQATVPPLEQLPTGQAPPAQPSTTVVVVMPPAAPPYPPMTRDWDDWQVQRRPPRPTEPRHWFFQADAGALVEYLYGDRAIGTTIALHAVTKETMGSGFVGGSFSYGSLQPGPSLFRGDVGGGYALRLDRFRLGFEAGMGVVNITSATNVDPSSTAFDLSLAAMTSIDLVPLDPSGDTAFFLAARLRAAFILATDAQPVLWGPSLVLGFRI